MSGIYICYCCGDPVIFRRNPPQIYHLGSGWACWQMQKAGICAGSGKSILIPRVRPPDERKAIVKEILRLYDQYKKTGDMRKVLELIVALLESDKRDCIRDVLEHIGADNDEVSRSLVNRLAATPQWRSLSRGVKKQFMFVKSVAVRSKPIAKRPGWSTITTRVVVIGSEGKPVPPTSVKITLRKPNHATKDYSCRTNEQGVAEFKIRARQTGTYKATVKGMRQAGWRWYNAESNQMNDNTCKVS